METYEKYGCHHVYEPYSTKMTRQPFKMDPQMDPIFWDCPGICSHRLGTFVEAWKLEDHLP